MSQLLEETRATSNKQLETLIKEAIKKLKIGKENDLCRYIPVTTGGHIHHFTMKKMKNEAPQQLIEMISKYVITVDQPKRVAPKKRASRHSRKGSGKFLFSPQELDRLRSIARLAGDKEMVSKLSPKMDQRVLARRLISSIKKGLVEQRLWEDYVESVMINQDTQAISP